MKTRSAYVRSPWQFEVREVDLPDDVAAGDVLLRVEACGVCGTDLTIAKADAKDWQPLGHEVAGVVEAVGPGVKHVKEGSRVVLETSSFCGVCDVCRDGRVDLCNKADKFWGRAAMGFSQRMTTPADAVVEYDGLSPEIACLAEPAGVAIDMVKTANVQLGDRVAVVGPGPIALMAIPLLLRSGAERVVCIGRGNNRQRLSTARELGAETVTAAEGELAQRGDLHKQFDHVIHTAPARTIPEALSLLRYGGEMTFIGIGSGSGRIEFDANDFHFRKLQLRASFASPALYFPMALRLLKAGIIPGEKIVSHRFALDQIGQAMDLCKAGTQGVKVVVKN